jgi:hypothetical protein
VARTATCLLCAAPLVWAHGVWMDDTAADLCPGGVYHVPSAAHTEGV